MPDVANSDIETLRDKWERGVVSINQVRHALYGLPPARLGGQLNFDLLGDVMLRDVHFDELVTAIDAEVDKADA